MNAERVNQWAYGIRILRNWGAQTQDYTFRNITPELAAEVKEFVDGFMNYVYMMPGKVRATPSRYQRNDELTDYDQEVEK